MSRYSRHHPRDAGTGSGSRPIRAAKSCFQSLEVLSMVAGDLLYARRPPKIISAVKRQSLFAGSFCGSGFLCTLLEFGRGQTYVPHGLRDITLPFGTLSS